MSSLNDKNQYWRSLEQLEESPELEKYLDEFPSQVDRLENPFDRRRFIQLMGASLAFAGVGLSGCKRWEREDIAPMASRPEGYIPGVPMQFATAMELGGAAIGVLAQSFDGRPTKIEGNPSHPFTGAASTPFAQASVLDLYDPDRSGQVRNNKLPAVWQDLVDQIKQKTTELGSGRGLMVLSEATDSPTLHRLRAALQRRYPEAAWHEWEPLSYDNVREGVRLAFGRPGRTINHIERARTVVALDDDLFLFSPGALANGRAFAQARRPGGDMVRLWAVESSFTTTGTVADHRLPLRSELVLPLLMAIDARLNNGPAPEAAFLAEPKIATYLDVLVEELQQNRGSSLITVGFRQPAEVHALAAKVNNDLGAIGRTVDYVQDPNPARPTHVEAITEAVTRMQAGAVDTLVILGGNPVYSAPADLDFAGALAKVGTSIHLSGQFDETSARCTWHVPRLHYLETWSDARAYDGTVSVIQPLIDPLFGGVSPAELVALFVGLDTKNAQQLVRDTFDQVAGGLGSKGWQKALHDGFVVNSQLMPIGGRPNAPQIQLTERQRGATRLSAADVEVVFTPSSHAYDGRFANNSWLQETPDFMTKLVWDNAALIGPATARDLGVAQGDMLRLTVDGRSLDVPAYVMPGQAPYSIAVALGHGRTHAGTIGGHDAEGIAPVGFDTYKLRGVAAPYIAAGSLAKAGRKHQLVTTQDHWQMDKVGRDGIAKRLKYLVQQVTIGDYEKATAGGHHGKGNHRYLPSLPSFLHRDDAVGHPPLESLWKEWEYDGYKWGMATDLSNCIGCNACMVACQAENNVPVVGKEQVAVSREMHWIRMDRYFKGDPDDPQMVHQPVLCQQCENAPCESVCPVGATLHSDEGLNDMVYNRCVGTRYCLNNCPYRVRRFNFLEYTDFDVNRARNKVRQLVFNPEVTVRSRGVMEKCTWCVQRIQAKKIEAKNERRHLRDGEIIPACAQACPTDTIVFGDLNNPKSRVRELHDSPRAYAMLGDLNTKPRNAFLARIRNPNPALG
jgi:MoCo/4Fe-4S cofactor protein with predicted Tat translocation signal